MTTMPTARATSAILFGCLFAAQAALVVTSPILPPPDLQACLGGDARSAKGRSSAVFS